MQETPATAQNVLDDTPPMTGARIFVTLVFVLLGLSFIAQTALVIAEFRGLDWPAMVLLHSHLFVFFPTLGVVALIAFHLPATVFTHMYWTYVPHGRARFIFGTFVVVVLTLVLAFRVSVSNPAELWEVRAPVLTADHAETVACSDKSQSCRRVALLDGISRLRDAASARLGMSKFARACAPDALMEQPAEQLAERRCFASDGNLSAKACCEVQARYSARLAEVTKGGVNRSLADQFDLIALPFKTFFVLVVVVIGVMLVIWRKLLEAKYVAIAPAIERALLIGAAAMIPWPFMDYAYSQAMETLSGRATDALEVRLSLIIGPWALLLLVFFLARMGRKIERLGQLAGACASIVAVLRYEQLNDVSVRLVGIGAPWWMALVLAAFIVTCLMMLRWPRHLQRAINGVVGRHPDVGMSPPPGFKT